MRKQWAWLAVTATLGLSSPVQAAGEDLVTTYQLDNGMDVVVIEDHRAPAVVHMVWYRAGAADEPPGTSGIAHFLEHLLFKATETRAAGELSRIVGANGGSDNAFTSQDYTAYFQRVAADRLGLMMDLESDRMVNIALTEEDILTERDVILEERAQRTDNEPGALFSEQRMAAQYLNHPYGIPIIGWRHEMEQLDMEDALAFYDQFYAPNNAILIVAGDVVPEEVLSLAREHYGVIPANPDLEPRARPQEPPQSAPRRLVFEDPRVAQPYVIRSYLAPERDSGDQETAAALTLFAELLGGGQTSHLTQSLQFDTQVAVYAGAFYRGTSLDDTTFGLVVVPSPGVSLQEAEDAMDAAVADFLEQGVDPEALERLKFQLRAQEVYSRDDVSALANVYGRALTSGLTVADVQAWPDILQAVTAEQIIAAGEALLADRRGTVTGWLTGPSSEEDTQ